MAYQNPTLELGMVLKKMADPAFVLDVEGRILFANPRAAGIFGMEAAGEREGGPVPREFPEPNRSLFLMKVREAARAREPAKFVHSVGLWHGTRWLETSLSPLPQPDGQCTQVLAVSRDVTDWKKAEREAAGLIDQLRKEREDFRAVFGSLPFGVAFSGDPGGRILQANPAMVSMLGLDPGDSASLSEGEASRLCIDQGGEPPGREIAWLQAAAAGTEIREKEIRILKRDGTLVPTLCWAVPLRASDGKASSLMVILKDETERRRQAELRRQSEEKLLRLRKTQVVQQIAGGIAHEFNNLFTAINGYTELVIGMRVGADPRQGYFEEILKAGSRAAVLTRQLLAYSRGLILKAWIVDVNAFVVDQAEMLKTRGDRNCLIDPVPEAERSGIKVDRAQLEQVLLHLVANAREAMPEGGAVTLRTFSLDVDGRLAEEHDVPPGPFVVLEVRDKGEGMAPEVQARVFEPFFTTKNGQHAGLGLAMVDGFVQQSGGFVQCESQAGHGTVFRLFFPAV